MFLPQHMFTSCVHLRQHTGQSPQLFPPRSKHGAIWALRSCSVLRRSISPEDGNGIFLRKRCLRINQHGGTTQKTEIDIRAVRISRHQNTPDRSGCRTEVWLPWSVLQANPDLAPESAQMKRNQHLYACKCRLRMFLLRAPWELTIGIRVKNLFR
jgi:hypothetical protein